MPETERFVKLALLILMVFTGAHWLIAQSAAPLTFDAASVRRSPDEPDRKGYSHQINPKGITMHAVSLGYCIRIAYNLSMQRPYELEGPQWLNPPTEFVYDIIGRSDSPATPEQLRGMLQSLLQERFNLAAHYDERDVPSFVLTRDARQTGLAPSGDSTKTKVRVGSKPNEYIFEHVSMSQLALQLGPPLASRPVVDRTGLPGSYDFKLDLSKYLADPETGQVIRGADGRIDEEGALFRATHEQLGLTLKPGRAPVRVLVVDHVEKSPTGDN
jgi:uncharacterized protein (TIGR03435 family)